MSDPATQSLILASCMLSDADMGPGSLNTRTNEQGGLACPMAAFDAWLKETYNPLANPLAPSGVPVEQYKFNAYFTEFLRQTVDYNGYVTVECQDDKSYLTDYFNYNGYLQYDKYPRYIMHSASFVTNIAWSW